MSNLRNRIKKNNNQQVAIKVLCTALWSDAHVSSLLPFFSYFMKALRFFRKRVIVPLPTERRKFDRTLRNFPQTREWRPSVGPAPSTAAAQQRAGVLSHRN